MSSQFGYQSLQDVSGTTVTSNVAAVSNPVSNAVDWRDDDYYQPDAAAASIQLLFYNPTAQPVDYIGIAGHNLFTLGARYKVDYSADGVTYNPALAYQTPADNGIQFVSFAQQSAKYFLVTIDRSDAAAIQPMIGMLFLGTKFDVGDAPEAGKYRLPLIDQDQGNANASMGGKWLGKSLYKTGLVQQIKFNCLTQSWLRTNWEPLMAHLQQKPCIFSPDETNYPGDAMLGWIDKAADMPQPQPMGANLFSATLKLTGVLQ